MPEISTTGYEKRIATEFPQLSRGQVKKAAKKIYWIAENMQEVFDFYEGMRILGITNDPTAKKAIGNLERIAA